MEPEVIVLFEKLKPLLDEHNDLIYKRIEDCDKTVEKEEAKIDNMTIELTKINTTLKALIAVLAPIAVAVLGVAVKLLFS